MDSMPSRSTAVAARMKTDQPCVRRDAGPLPSSLALAFSIACNTQHTATSTTSSVSVSISRLVGQSAGRSSQLNELILLESMVCASDMMLAS